MAGTDDDAAGVGVGVRASSPLQVDDDDGGTSEDASQALDSPVQTEKPAHRPSSPQLPAEIKSTTAHQAEGGTKSRSVAARLKGEYGGGEETQKPEGADMPSGRAHPNEKVEGREEGSKQAPGALSFARIMQRNKAKMFALSSFKQSTSIGKRQSSILLGSGDVQEDFFAACGSNIHTQTDAEFCVRLLHANRELAKGTNPAGMLPLHLLCRAPGHNQYSVEICVALLDAHKEAVVERLQEPGEHEGLLPLHLLCRQHNLTEHSTEICRLILAGHEQTTSVLSKGKHALSIVVEDHSVVSDFHVHIFRRLLEANKECLKHKDSQGRTILHRLCISSQRRLHSENIAECIRLILDVNKRTAEAEDESKCKPIHLVCTSPKPTDHTITILDMLMNVVQESVSAKDQEGLIPLHHVCRNGNLTEVSTRLCRKFLETYPLGARVLDKSGQSALHFLCSSQRLSVHTVVLVRQIVSTYKRAVSLADKDGRWPLHTFCASMGANRKGMKHAEEIYHILLDVDPSTLAQPDSGGKLPLHLLCEAGFFSNDAIRMLEEMLAINKDEAMVPDSAGRLPVHLLCESKLHTQLTYDAYKRLTQSSRENVSKIQAHDGSLLLHALCGAGKHSRFSVDMFRALVESHPAGISAFDSSGQVPIHKLCGASGHSIDTEELFTELLDALAKIGKSGAALKNLQGWLPLHIVCGADNQTEHTYRIFSKLLMLSEGSCMTATTRERWLPIHVLLRAPDHSQYSAKMCYDLLRVNRGSVNETDDSDISPLETLCNCGNLSVHSVEICKQITTCLDKNYTWVGALTMLCSNPQVNQHSVAICEILLGKMKEFGVQPDDRSLPLHALCSLASHKDENEKICNMLLAQYPDWTKMTDENGWLPLHLLCNCKCHQPQAVRICQLLLRANPDSVLAKGKGDVQPLHVIAGNGLHTRSSKQIFRQLMDGAGKTGLSARGAEGYLPLHYLCLSKTLSEFSVEICDLMLRTYPAASWTPPSSEDSDLPLHKICLTTPHSAQSVKVARLLINSFPDALRWSGNLHDPIKVKEFEVSGVRPRADDGDVPLLILCQGDSFTRHTASLCMMVAGDGAFNMNPSLAHLHQKVYRPKGDETQQRLALRCLISLAFVRVEDVATYIGLDADATNGASDLAFFKAVEREMGGESDNPLFHVIQMANLYKVMADEATSGTLGLILNELSQFCMEWAVAMVEALPAKIAKKAIWNPEQYAKRFMRGPSPIGIALNLGDLHVVSSAAVFDVVRRAWPGKYKYDFNPLNGNIFSNLFLEFDIQGGINERRIVWTWHRRVVELMMPSVLLSSPMNMYFLDVMMQVSLLVMFQVTMDYSHYERKFLYSMGYPELYVIIHVGGGIVYELGQFLEEGAFGYWQDPWNLIDVGMYSLLSWWVYARSKDWADLQIANDDLSLEEGTQAIRFIPMTTGNSATYLGLAGICIWIRMLNVFGLDPYFGPLVRIMQGMSLGVGTFLVLIAVFVMGFSTSLRTIVASLDPDDPEVIKHGWSSLIEEFKDPLFSLILLLNMALGQFDLTIIYQISPLALFVVVSFLTCTFIMLFNLLIALMTDTYSAIRLESEKLWRKDRAMLMASYTTTDVMLNRFRFHNLMTGLPTPLNLLVTLGTILLLPFNVLISLTTARTKTWERQMNDLRMFVTKSVVFLVVCLPTTVFFTFVALPLNWIFVASSGTLDYMGSRIFMRFPQRRIIVSKLIGFALTPFFLIYFSCIGIWLLFQGSRSDEDLDDSSSASSDVVGERFGYCLTEEMSEFVCYGNSEQSDSRLYVSGSSLGQKEVTGPSDKTELSSRGEKREHVDASDDMKGHHYHDHDHDDHHDQEHRRERKVRVKEIWQEDLDEDDILVLQEALLSSKPQDPEDIEAAAELAQREKDQAIYELRSDMTKILLKLEQRQKGTTEFVQDFQLETTKFAHDTVRDLQSIQENLKIGLREMATTATKNQQALLQIINEHAELNSKRFLEHNEKINLLLSAVCGPVAARRTGEEPPEPTEGGLLLAAFDRRLKHLEAQEQEELSMLRDLLKQGNSCTDSKVEQVDEHGRTVLSKVSTIENAIPQIFKDVLERLVQVEQNSNKKIESLRSEIFQDISPVLRDLDDRVKKGEELQQSSHMQMRDSLSVLAGISPALAGIEARLNANAVDMQRMAKTEMGEQLSWALESKLGELISEVQIRLGPNVTDDLTSARSSDKRVESMRESDKMKYVPKPSSANLVPRPTHKNINGSHATNGPPGHYAKSTSPAPFASDINGAARKSDSLDDRIDHVLSALEGKAAETPPEWQKEWERRQSLKGRSPFAWR